MRSATRPVRPLPTCILFTSLSIGLVLSPAHARGDAGAGEADEPGVPERAPSDAGKTEQPNSDAGAPDPQRRADAGAPAPEGEPSADAATPASGGQTSARTGTGGTGGGQPPGIPGMEPPEPPDTGIIGRVLDAKTGKGIIEGQVVVVGRGKKVITDLQGNFTIELPPGTYTLRSFYEFYKAERVKNVRVKPGKATEVTIELQPERGDRYAEEVVVEAHADTSTEETQLKIRKKSTTVRDAVSAEEMSKSGDSTAGSAARRIVSASLTRNNFLVIRGLRGRYTNVLLNGLEMPSIDPDRPSVRLSIFPADLLSSIAVNKTFTPDMLGNFTGGSMNISTQQYPNEFTLETSLSFGFNTKSTFQSMPSYDGGKLDWLGFDDGSRALPGVIPRNTRARSTRDNDISQEDEERFGEAFPNNWNIESKKGVPPISASATVGDSTKVAGNRLGYLLAFNYSYTDQRKTGVQRDVRFQDDNKALEKTTDLDLEIGKEQVLWGTLGSLTYELTKDDELSLVALWSQNTTDAAQRSQGLTRRSDGGTVDRWRFRFIERSVFFSQLRGEHRHLGLPPDATFNWNLFASYGVRDEPDTRGITYRDRTPGDDKDIFFLESKSQSASRLFMELDQVEFGGGTQLTIPIRNAELKLGGRVRQGQRTFSLRRFRYVWSPGGDPRPPSDFRTQQGGELKPEELITEEAIGPWFSLEDESRATDSYRSEEELYAAFAMMEIPVTDTGLRFVGGARGEAFKQNVRSRSPFRDVRTEEGTTNRTNRTDVDILPSVGAIYELVEDMFLRTSYSATVARPQIRELAPFQFFDFVRQRNITGNPDLDRAKIHNVDLRWEMFPAATEVLAASVFYKKFIDPIERIITNPRTSDASFANAKGAHNYGFELETRVGFGRFHEALEGFSFGGNFAYIQSQIELTEEQATFVTNQDRPLQDQSPYVANLSLGFEDPDTGISIFGFYNVFGPRITDVGTDASSVATGLPDVKQQSFHSLDVNIRWQTNEHLQLKLSASNLASDEVVLKQGDIAIQTADPGTTVSIGATWRH